MSSRGPSWRRSNGGGKNTDSSCRLPGGAGQLSRAPQAVGETVSAIRGVAADPPLKLPVTRMLRPSAVRRRPIGASRSVPSIRIGPAPAGSLARGRVGRMSSQAAPTLLFRATRPKSERRSPRRSPAERTASHTPPTRSSPSAPPGAWRTPDPRRSAASLPPAYGPIPPRSTSQSRATSVSPAYAAASAYTSMAAAARALPGESPGAIAMPSGVSV
jgi:hypothetical protein